MPEHCRMLRHIEMLHAIIIFAIDADDAATISFCRFRRCRAEMLLSAIAYAFAADYAVIFFHYLFRSHIAAELMAMLRCRH